MTAQASDSDPLEQLLAEHRFFRDRTASFLETVRRYENLIGTVPLDAPMVHDFAKFLSNDVDQRHGAKEEQGLFPALRRHLPDEDGPVAVLLAEHQDLRGLQRHFLEDAHRLEADPEEPRAQGSVLSNAATVHDLLGTHIDKEETVLFPMARGMLTPSDLSTVREAFRGVDAKMGVIVLPSPSSSRGPGGGLPPFCAAGRANREQAERRSPR